MFEVSVFVGVESTAHKMFSLGLFCLVASAMAHPATETRPPIIDYAVPMGYYPGAPLLRASMPVVIEEPKGEKHEEKGTVAAFADAPFLPPLEFPFVHEVVVEPKKEESDKPEAKSDKPEPEKSEPEKQDSEKPEPEKPMKPEEDKLTTVKLEMAHPPIVRAAWPSWLQIPFKIPEVPIISNILSYINPSGRIAYSAIPYPEPILH